MNQQILSAIAFLGGVCLAVQATFSSQLGFILRKPIAASFSTYTTGALLALVLILTLSKENISMQSLRQVPWYLWFLGGLFSVSGITLYYYTIPKIGISRVIALGLCGQLVFSMIASHFGWLGLPMSAINIKRIIGAVALGIGVFLMTSK